MVDSNVKMYLNMSEFIYNENVTIYFSNLFLKSYNVLTYEVK
jgi:hypothetical protein